MNLQEQISRIKGIMQLKETYPAGWDMDEFKKLNSFEKRIKYCNTHLTKLGFGSSRIVYKIDDEKALKLAKNRKGLAQNELEIILSNSSNLDGIVAETFDHSEDNSWVEMELAKELTPDLFKQITGLDWNDYIENIEIHYKYVNSNSNNKSREDFWYNDFALDMFILIGDYMGTIPVGDLMKTSSYGVVKRNGKDKIVLVDYGLSIEIFDKHYRKNFRFL